MEEIVSVYVKWYHSLFTLHIRTGDERLGRHITAPFTDFSWWAKAPSDRYLHRDRSGHKRSSVDISNLSSTVTHV